ncbi:MAG: hypothetical protein ACOCV2_09420 [Persicimonas sp.]
MALQTDWKGHTLEVAGDWTWRWLFLAPIYELRIDGEMVERTGGPRVRPRLEAVIESEDDGSLYHVTAELTSIVGFRPSCTLSVDEEVLIDDHLRVDNFLNPFLVLFIAVCTGILIYVGPEAFGDLL